MNFELLRSIFASLGEVELSQLFSQRRNDCLKVLFVLFFWVILSDLITCREIYNITMLYDHKYRSYIFLALFNII